MAARLGGAAAAPGAALPEAPPEIAATVERPAYEAAVRRAVGHILAGDVFQVNLAQRFTTPPARPG